MKVIRLQAENIKRLVAVDITPDGALVTVGGKNGAGKSSVLDSIAYALGGAALVPDMPIRRGEQTATITVDLDKYIVTRKFWYEKLPCDCMNVPLPDVVLHAPSCANLQPGSVKTQLKVQNRDGSTFASPQQMLDKLLGELSFDPLEFANEKPAEQRKILMRLIKLDVSDILEKRAELVAARTGARRNATAAELAVTKMPGHLNVPLTETPMQEVADELAAATRLAEESRRLARAHEDTKRQADAQLRLCAQTAADILELENRLHKIRDEHKAQVAYADALGGAVTAAHDAWEVAEAKVPNLEALQRRVSEVDEQNRKVRENQALAQKRLEVIQFNDLHDRHDAAIIRLDAEKTKRIVDAAYPVPGLSVSDTGVMFNGVPLDQASTAEKIRVSLAIGLAMNPTLKVLLIREGSLLDDDGLAALAEQAAAADAQVWVEKVAKTADGLTVLLEDGKAV